mgnify:CR=1 FL=1
MRLNLIRRGLNRSSFVIMILGVTALGSNAFWMWHDRNLLPSGDLFELNFWRHPAIMNSFIIAVIMIYALRQISRNREKLSHLGYPLIEHTSHYRGMDIWRSVEPLTKRPVMLHVIRQEKFPGQREDWKSVSHQWIKRGEKSKRLTSPHIARVLDCGMAVKNIFYFAVEMPRGISLRAFVQLYGACPVERTAYFMAQIAHAVQDVHHHELNNLRLDPSLIYVGVRASNYDWITVVISGCDENPASIPMNDTDQFIRIALGLMTGNWPDKDMATTAALTSSMENQYQVSYAMIYDWLRLLSIQEPGERPTVMEIARRMTSTMTTRSWNQDRAAAWWKKIEVNADNKDGT